MYGHYPLGRSTLHASSDLSGHSLVWRQVSTHSGSLQTPDQPEQDFEGIEIEIQLMVVLGVARQPLSRLR